MHWLPLHFGVVDWPFLNVKKGNDVIGWVEGRVVDFVAVVVDLRFGIYAQRGGQFPLPTYHLLQNQHHR